MHTEPPIPNARPIDELVLLEQGRHIHRELLPSFLTGICTALLIAIVFPDTVGKLYTAGFLFILLALGLWQLAMWKRFRRAPPSVLEAQHLLYGASLAFFFTSVVWSFAVYMFFPAEHFPQRLALFAALLLSGTVSMFSLGIYLPAFVAAIVPMGTIVAAMLALQGPLDDPMLATTVIYVPVILTIAKRFNRLLVNTLRTGFRNTDLVHQLTVQRHIANAATQSRDIFLASANHDLRQPMHALNLYLGILSEHVLPEQVRPIVTNLELCAKSMNQMFSALLDIWRLDSQVTPVQAAVFPMQAILDQIRMEFTPQARGQGLALHVAPCSLLVMGDHALVLRIVRNLMSNAVRYTVRGKVLLGCRRHAGMVRLQVCDTGLGIAPEQQLKVFHEFYQVNNPGRDRTLGLGLGLSIVQRLARSLNMPFALHSVLGRGSVFSIDLPTVVTEGHEAMPTLVAPRPGSAGAVSPLIVVIEDEKLLLHATQLALEQAGYEVIAAESQAAVMERLSSLSRVPDAIICDNRLSAGGLGTQLVAAIRSEFNQEIPALLVTGDTAPERLLEIQASGLPVLFKPVQMATLRHALARILSTASIENE